MSDHRYIVQKRVIYPDFTDCFYDNYYNQRLRQSK